MRKTLDETGIEETGGREGSLRRSRGFAALARASSSGMLSLSTADTRLIKFATRSASRSRKMPHVIVKLWPGKSEQQKERLAEKIAKDVMEILNYGEESVSVGFEEISSKDWKEKVYKSDIKDKWDKLYKKPGYEM
jgi:4-oxalocrotonate tautomerase